MSAVADLTVARPAGLDEDEAMFLDAVRDVTRAEVEPRARAIDEAAALPADLLDTLGAQELDRIAAPERLGGAAGRPLVALLAVEQIAEASAAVACAIGERQAALAGLARLDGDGLEAHAVADGGEQLRIAGGRADGIVAQVLLPTGDGPLLALGVDADGAPAAAAVPAGAARIAGRRARGGLRGTATATLRFEGARLAHEGGAGAASAARAHRRLAFAAAALGVGRRAVAEAAAYLQERHQFGRPIGEFGALRRMLADATGGVAAAAALAHVAADRPEPSPAVVTLAARGAGAAAVAAADACVQLHGGYGYISEYVAERLLRDALALRALAGGRRQGTASAPLLGAEPA